MQNCLILFLKRKPDFSSTRILPAVLFYLLYLLQAPCLTETSPLSLHFSPLPCSCLAEAGILITCRLKGERYPRYPRIYAELIDCSGTLQDRQVCLPAAAHREAAWRRCLSLSPSRSLHALEFLLSVCLMLLPVVFESLPQIHLPYLYSHTDYWALPGEDFLEHKYRLLWGCLLHATVCIWRRCAFYHTSTHTYHLHVY